jgi:foldase protein PrsA
MNPRRSLFLPALLASAVLLAACSEADPPAATVSDVEITDQQVATTAAVYRTILGIQQVPCGELEGEGDTQEAACNRFALSQLIGLTLAEAYADEAGISVPDEDVEAEVVALEEGLGAEVVADALAENGATRDDLLALARAFLLQGEARRAIVVDELGEEGLQDVYEESAGDYMVVDVDHILVQTEEEARDVYEQVTAPGATREDFQALAEELSIDPSAKQNSGALGAAPASNYAPEFAQAAVALEPGEISEPVQTQYGWHVIRLASKEVTPFEDVRDDLIDAQSSTVFAEWVTAKDEQGEIEVNPSFGRFDRTTLTVVRISSTDPSAASSPSEPVNVVPADG